MNDELINGDLDGVAGDGELTDDGLARVQSTVGRTKIVATVGPASESAEVLQAMMLAGVDVVRLNLSHGPLDEHIQRLRVVRAASLAVGRPIAILADLPGPKVRAGRFPDDGVELVVGSIVRMRPGNDDSTVANVCVDYPSLLLDVQPGDRIVVGDGGISLRCTSVGVVDMTALVESGGRVQGRPGVHLPSERLRLTAPTDEDLVLAAAMAAEGTDFLGVSFVRTAADMDKVRAAIAPHATRLIAKIETIPAITNLESIIAVSDAVMVARGDLGIECPLEDVPHFQKQIIRHCVQVGVPVITATQMLESMIVSPAPTRAEVSDVANAVFDGTDALMLSAETAIGHDPVLVVRTMARIAERAESEASYRQWSARLGRMQRTQWTDSSDRITMAITHACAQAAADAGAEAILCCTRSGRTASAMARFRPSANLIGISPDPATVRAMSLTWGVRPIQVDSYRSTDELVWFAIEAAVRERMISAGSVVAVLAGAPDRASGAATDVLRLVRIE
ncbi:MAG: pyruvate kinase [Ilumatobacteraceae bacterium]